MISWQTVALAGIVAVVCVVYFWFRHLTDVRKIQARSQEEAALVNAFSKLTQVNSKVDQKEGASSLHNGVEKSNVKSDQA